MSDNSPRFLTYRQASELLQVSDRTVFSLVKSGQLRAVRFNHTVRIDLLDLEAFIQQAKNGKGVPGAD